MRQRQRQAARMLELRGKLRAIDPFFPMQPDEPGETWGAIARRDYYRKLADLTSGKTGEMVAVLPEVAAFSTDPYDEGFFRESGIGLMWTQGNGAWFPLFVRSTARATRT